MPLYQYRCPRHGRFETFATMKECSHKQECPKCEALCDREFVPVEVISDTSLFTADRLDGSSRSGLKDDTYIGNKFRKMAKAAGVVTRGKQYMGGLARFPGDPQAWVGDRGDIKRIAEKENYSVDGIVKRKVEAGPPPEKGLSEKLVNRYVEQELARNPGRKREHVVAEVIDRHAPKNGKRIIKNRSRKPKR